MELSSFLDNNLFEAGTFFFNQLKVPLNSSTAISLNIRDILKDRFKDDGIFNQVTETYFLGLVDDSVFAENLSLLETTNISFEDASRKIHADYEGLMVFAVKIDGNTAPARTQISDLTRAFNRASKNLPVVLLLHCGACISLATSERTTYKQTWREGEKIGKVSLLKDIDIQNPHTGHLKILLDLIIKPDVRNFSGLYEQWMQVFDVQLLNKRFYKELVNWYFWARREVTFPSQNDIGEDIRNPINVIRLITRMIFVWFIKEKGLVPEAIFEKRQVKKLLRDFSPESSSYYKGILQNLFFATLNTNMGNRKFRDERRFQGKSNGYMLHNFFRYRSYFNNTTDILELLRDTPFLNGGLFECLDRETVPITRIDGFSDRLDSELHVPNNLFFSDDRIVDLNDDFGTKGKKYKVRGLVDLLQSYKFTITENTPIEEEIALDPELLGRVFENLLASYNPETRISARKLTGSFYTPREIVNYMVDESLIAYLKTALISDYEKQLEFEAKKPQAQQKMFGKQNAVQMKLAPVAKRTPPKKREQITKNLRHLLSYSEEPHGFDSHETDVLVHAIDNIKILDPACGSGAFPMGILHRLVFILDKLDPKNRQWKNKQIAKAEKIEIPSARKAAIDDIEQAFDYNSLDYARKLYLIQNCIFGVDIQPVAVQIAKLRFFISLIVEQDIDENADNRGMMPLPNLETKIVAANSLIGFKGESPLKGQNIIDLEKELKHIRRQYFGARTRKTKRKCEEKDKQLREKISRLIKDHDFSKDTDINLDQWDPYNQNETAGFFDPEWMFGEKQGFDIVIGNPPYVRQEKIRDLKPMLKKKYKCYTGMADLYVYFFERGFDILKTDGILSYISSNKYFRSAYGKKLRHLLATRSSIFQLIDFGDIPIFTSVAYPSIIIFKKLGVGVSNGVVRRMMFGDQNQGTANIKALNWQIGPSIDSFPEIFNNQRFTLPQSALTDDGWRLEPPEVLRLLEKLRMAGEPLGEFVNGKFYRGILTGLNEAFVVDRPTRDLLIKDDPNCTGLFKPFLRGKNVKRWKVGFDDEYLIKIESSANKEHPWTGKEDAEAESIFARTYPSIHKHFQRFRDRLMKRDDQGKYFWELRSCKYWNAFEKPKIIYPDIAQHSEFTYDMDGFFIINTLYLLPTDKVWLTGVLNSKVVFWFYKKISTQIRGGFVRFIAQYVSQIPIPNATRIKKINTLSEQIVSFRHSDESTDLKAIEAEIDGRVAHLYNLTEEEYALVLKETDCPDPFRVAALNVYRDIDRGKLK